MVHRRIKSGFCRFYATAWIFFGQAQTRPKILHNLKTTFKYTMKTFCCKVGRDLNLFFIQLNLPWAKILLDKYTNGYLYIIYTILLYCMILRTNAIFNSNSLVVLRTKGNSKRYVWVFTLKSWITKINLTCQD